MASQLFEDMGSVTADVRLASQAENESWYTLSRRSEVFALTFDAFRKCCEIFDYKSAAALGGLLEKMYANDIKAERVKTPRTIVVNSVTVGSIDDRKAQLIERIAKLSTGGNPAGANTTGG
jgi:hypothetical protein